jgi:hypothetical protein
VTTPENQVAIANFLCDLLHHEDARIRARAAKALGKLGLESTIPNLCQTVTEDPDLQVRLTAIDALVLIAKPELSMTEPAKNQPTFQINQVGNLNTGDVTIQGDQVGFQSNYAFPDPESAEATRAVSELLQDIRQRYPQASDDDILAIIEKGFATLQRGNPKKWRKWVDLFSLVFAGGLEAVKVVAPALGIPIEVGKRLYEICDRQRQQLPGT